MQTRLTLRPGQRGTKKHERRLREKIKAAGGRWHPDHVAWSLPHDRIVSLGLTDRMLAEPFASEKSITPKSKVRGHYI